MSFQTFVTERLSAITAQLNAITINAKRIFELPVQPTLVPTSKIHVSNNGTSECVEIQQIINAAVSLQNDQILTIGALVLAGNNLTVPLGVSWKINNVIYSKNTDTIITIPFCATGLNRKDIIIADTNGNILRIAGNETIGIVVAPTVPLNTLLITEVDVTDSTIGNPSPPILGNSSNKGYYNITTNVPVLVNGTGQAGDYVTCTVAGTRNFGAGNITVGANDRLEYDGAIWFKAVNNNQGGGGSVNITNTELTYISSAIFTIPQNAQILSVIVGEIRDLKPSRYTYNPSLSTNNFEITDTTYLAELESGETIVIKTTS